MVNSAVVGQSILLGEHRDLKIQDVVEEARASCPVETETLQQPRRISYRGSLPYYCTFTSINTLELTKHN